MIDFTCHYCGETLRMDDSFAGRDGWCRACKRMVIVPEGGCAMTVEDLPPGEAIARLQKLLRYAARKADEHKRGIDPKLGDNRHGTLEATTKELRDALATQLIRGNTLQAEVDTLRNALSQAEARQRELEADRLLAMSAPVESANDHIAEVEAALASERELRACLEEQASARDADLRGRCNALEEERDAAQALIGQLEDRLLEAREETTSLQASMDSARSEYDLLATESSALKLQIQEERDQLTQARDAAQDTIDKSGVLEAELAAARTQLEVYEGELQAAHDENFRLQDSVQWVRSEFESLESELTSARLQLQDAENERDRLIAVRNALQARVEESSKAAAEGAAALKRAAACETKLQASRQEHGLLKATLDRVTMERESLESELVEVKRQLKDTEDERDQWMQARDIAPERGDQSDDLDSIEAAGGARLHQQDRPDAGLEAACLDPQDAEPVEAIGELGAAEEAAETEGAPTASHCAAKRPWAILPRELGGGASHLLHVTGNASLGKATKDMGKEAFVDRWHREAEVPGASQAQFRLGVRYEKGLGVDQNHAEALRWLVRAAEQGHAGAQYHLGRMYADGRGVVKNFTMALDWFRKAAEQGDDGAQCELGLMCLTGTGLSRDEVAALSWFRKAAEQGNPAALYQLGILHIEGGSAPMNPLLAFDYFQRAAEQGHADAQHRVGQMLIDGMVVPRDECRALECFDKAAEQGHALAQYALGMCLERGRGAVQNYIRAYAWYNLAAVRLDQARAARDRLATLMLPEQILQGQQLAEDMHIKRQADEVASR